ncbi:MAG TPA: LLM class flavin-dependent oxidoreductase [Acidimicrobiia bacterium]|nr:LLM class flavin-dependent oxidoreductase [Acidimicrobiia bacterium]
MSDLRFGVLVDTDAPFAELAERWIEVEELGFDQLVVPDHSCDYLEHRHVWHEAWTALTAAAMATNRVRVGPLVANPILRPPALLARSALSLDHLSGGRLELGIGMGVQAFDHRAAGTPVWEPKERADRFDEYVTVVDGLLTSAKEPFSFAGRYHATHETGFQPEAIQHPRPPIVVGGQSPTVLRVAAERADGWNTHGPYGAGLDEIVSITREQNQRIDRLCEDAGRDPSAVRRSLLLFNSLAPWNAPERFGEIVERFYEVGMREFVLFWPADDEQLEVFEHIASHVIPRLRHDH